MSAIFPDQLPSLIDTSRSPTEFLDVSLLKLSNIRERSPTIPEYVGTLPLRHFIYILIGVLVFLCCSFSIWQIFRIIISPRKYLEQMRSESRPDVTSPYREKRPPVPRRVNTTTRGEVEKYRAQERYQADGFLEPLLVANPNLPFPVEREIQVADLEQPRAGINTHEIEAWGNLVKEKEKLNTTIANLERLTQVQNQAGSLGAIDPRLHAALQRRAEVEKAINAGYNGFRERRGEWRTEEWQVVELIMQYSP
jgi:hypothetical protein